VNVSVLDKDTGKPLDGTVEVIRMVGREEVVQGRNPFLGGKATLDVPGTVRMRARVTGYKAATRSIFLDHQPLLQVALDMRAEHLTDARTFEKIAELLKSVKLEFALERE
jgi:hypothetical protein